MVVSDISFNRVTTRFTCKLCDVTIKFSIFDKTSYLSKTDTKQFFGIEIATFRVAHVVGNVRHVNSILVDEKGLFRSYVDAYAEEYQTEPHKKFWLAPNENHFDFVSKTTELLFVYDKKELWVLDLYGGEKFQLANIAKLSEEEIKKASEIYAEFPNPFTVKFADKEFFLWNYEKQVFGGIFKDKTTVQIFDTIIREYFKRYVTLEELLTKIRAIHIALRCIEDRSEKIRPVHVVRLLTDDILYFPLEMKYKEKIPFVVNKLISFFDISEENLTKLLSGKATVIDLLETADFEKLDRYLDVLDFLNDRKLLE